MSKIIQRKQQHIQIVLNENVEPEYSSFDFFDLPYVALPEINFEDIDTSTKFEGFKFSFPFFISSMTGGTRYSQTINQNIAIACEEEKIGFGLGSCRVIDSKPDSIKSFSVKKLCPSVPMFANLGLVQLNYGFTYEKIQKIVDTIQADGIFFHINHLQEVVQPEGNTNFKDLLKKFEKVMKKISIPVIVKEVGHGIDGMTAKKLVDVGVKYIDVSGLGGTSWAYIEGFRRLENNEKMDKYNLGYLLKDKGILTSDAIIQCKKIKNLSIIAGGGVRSGIDVAKALMLGASYATSARPFLKAAIKSPENVIKLIRNYRNELKCAMFSAGILKIKDLRKYSR